MVAALRLKSRVNGKPGPVKISFQSTEEKIEVPRRKRDLPEVDVYKFVFLRSSKSHTERLIELNAKIILNQIPSGNQFRITSNGRVVKKSFDFHPNDPSNTPDANLAESTMWQSPRHISTIKLGHINVSAAGLWRMGNSENK